MRGLLGGLRIDSDARFAYGATLGLLIASIVVTIASGSSGAAPATSGVLQGFALIFTLSVSGVTRRTLLIAVLLGVTATSAATAFTQLSLSGSPVVGPVLWALIVAATIAAILRHLGRVASVDAQTVMALLSIYLLLGLFFGYVFMLTDALTGGFFARGDAHAGSFVYFSFVTIATVGYGDLAPQEGLPRALAVAEAIIGQLYLVTVVALAVSRMSRKRTGDQQGRGL